MTDEELKEQFEKTWRHFDELRLDVHAEVADVKRHMDVVAERMGKRFELLAEGLSLLDEKADRNFGEVREEMKSGFTETHALIRFGYRDLDRRKP